MGLNSDIFPVRMCFKGARDYLHGTDIYQALVQVAREQLGQESLRLKISIHRFFKMEPDIHWFEHGPSTAKPQNAVADFSIFSDRQRAVGWLVESARRVDCRVPYDEERIARYCDLIDKTILVREDSGCLPIEVLVSMTKQLHNDLLKPPTGRWIFTKLHLHRLLEPADASVLRITLEENLYGRLTRSALTAGREAIGAIYFSLVKP